MALSKSPCFSNKTAIPAECQGRKASSARCKTEFWKGNPTEMSKTDFPALIIYNAIYDVYFNGKKIVSVELFTGTHSGDLAMGPNSIPATNKKDRKSVV